MRIGILGAGQLGRMLALSGKSLGMDFIFYDKSDKPCASALGKVYKRFPAFAEAADIYTYEFENVPLHLARRLARRRALFPSYAALETAADRRREKKLFASLGIRTVRWREVKNEASLYTALEKIGFPFLLKTAQMGYDGKGQVVLQDERRLKRLKQKLFFPQHPVYIAEEMALIKREVSLIAARARDGSVVYYPPVENIHKQGVLYSSFAPASLSAQENEKLKGWVAAIMKNLSYVGVMALELFETAEGFFANEMAPRVHNSGHWTIEGTSCSQFANHIRAISNMPLGQPVALGCSAMFNFVGQLPQGRAQQELLGVANSHLHIYGKKARAGRKLGHWTVVTDAPDKRLYEKMRKHKFFVR